MNWRQWYPTKNLRGNFSTVRSNLYYITVEIRLEHKISFIKHCLLRSEKKKVIVFSHLTDNSINYTEFNNFFFFFFLFLTQERLLLLTIFSNSFLFFHSFNGLNIGSTAMNFCCPHYSDETQMKLLGYSNLTSVLSLSQTIYMWWFISAARKLLVQLLFS